MPRNLPGSDIVRLVLARFFRFMNILKMSMDMKCKCGSVIPEGRWYEDKNVEFGWYNFRYDYRAGCIYVESDWGCPEESQSA